MQDSEMDRRIPETKPRRQRYRWTFRRLADLILRVVRLCAAFQSNELTDTQDARSSQGTRCHNHGVSKAQSSRRQPLTLLQLAQPESWHQLNRDIQQRMQHTHSLLHRESGDSSSTIQHSISGKLPQSLPSGVRETLSKPPWTRTHRQVEQAAEELKACSDFRDYPVSLQSNLCKVGWYLSLGQGRVIFREHSPPSCFYFIISGHVLMTSEQEPAHTLTAGASFGDHAIIERSNRTMTCSVENHVELFVISKSDFLDLSLRQARISYQKTKHFTFCKSVSILKHWPMHLLEAHPEQCKVTYFKTNTVVVKNSTRNPWVYVVMSGSCRVVKRFVYGSDEQSMAKKRKSFSNPTEISKLALASESAATKLLPAQGTMQQKQMTLLKNKHPISRGAAADLLQRKGRRLPHTISTPQMTERQHLLLAPKKQFLVQLQLLQPKDTFGLSSFVHPDEPSVTLVSNGAEIVMLSKEFLLEHFTETIGNKLKRQITQFPSQEAMLKRIREHYSWNTYKQSIVSNSRRRM